MVCLSSEYVVSLDVSMYKYVCMWLYLCARVRVHVWLNEIPDGYTGQADVSLWGPAEVDWVAVQTDVLQCIPDVVEIIQVAECVLMHHLNVVALQQKREGYSWKLNY